MHTNQVEAGRAIVIITTAYAVALPLWFMRRRPTGIRTVLLIGQGAILFALPWTYRIDSVPLNAVVTLACCAAIPPKLFDTYLHPEHWHNRPFREWFIYLLVPFVLVHRLHVDAPSGWAAARKPGFRGILEISLGALLLWLAFRWFDAGPAGLRANFWFEHGIKLIAAYLIAFEGGFVLATALVRALGLRTLELSCDPILAVTPADFWRRYNCEAGRLLREDLYFPLGGRRRPILMTIVIFIVNGLLHEYLALIMVGRVTGYQTAFFTLHGLATAATLRLRPGRWPIWVRIFGWLATMLFLYATSILFFATVDLIVPWYRNRPGVVQ